MDFVETVAEIDRSHNLHAARLLLLLDAFAGAQREGAIDGLTKLAKLDFLLRYPTLLERALEARKRSTKQVVVEDHERHCVESEMVRYRFGPWDHRYRELLNILVGRGLATISIDGRRISISITALGRTHARSLASNSLFEPYDRRASLLKRHFDLTGNYLMKFIYKTFPEILSLRSNARILL